MSGPDVPKRNKESLQAQQLAQTIKQTAIQRDAVTNRLLSSLLEGGSVRGFVEKACELAKIKPPKPQETMAYAVYKLQKLLEFPETDTAHGCDGQLGPYTFNALIRVFPILDPHRRTEVQKRAQEKRQTLARTAGLPTPPITRAKEKKPKATVEREPIKPSDTVYFGDSLTHQYARHILSRSAFRRHKNKDFKIGRWARTMRKRMERNLDYYASKSAIVIGAGTNDLEHRSANAIAGDLEAMYSMLIKKNPQIRIVTLTLLPYPGNSARNRKIQAINNRIRSFARKFPRNFRLVDMHKSFVDAMRSGKKMLYGDRVHMRPKASRAVAQMIKDTLETGSHKKIEEYLS
ncbi:hypothetical protein GF369_02180 [Candidatus Peregrinibacteria bacterium]|nr:hypothetical protein [Candidatus Peregrinibacteria bacterium]